MTIFANSKVTNTKAISKSSGTKSKAKVCKGPKNVRGTLNKRQFFEDDQPIEELSFSPASYYANEDKDNFYRDFCMENILPDTQTSSENEVFACFRRELEDVDDLKIRWEHYPREDFY